MAILSEVENMANSFLSQSASTLGHHTRTILVNCSSNVLYMDSTREATFSSLSIVKPLTSRPWGVGWFNSCRRCILLGFIHLVLHCFPCFFVRSRVFDNFCGIFVTV
uniref:Uncharacterized protein n=1 Tax=Cacopsylla melanoneura TaxID=428564 RepID=A0A8D8QVN4_9HEMI